MPRTSYEVFENGQGNPKKKKKDYYDYSPWNFVNLSKDKMVPNI